MRETNKGMLLVVSGPSGAGKGTLTSRLLEADPSFAVSVSCTTRAPRPAEIPDVHYHFITEERFDELLAEDAFVEHAQVHGHRYGTLKREVYSRMHAGVNVLLEIDPQGAAEVMRQVPECVTVFIIPPSYEELLQRLLNRSTESRNDIERRMRNATGEVARMGSYQYVIVNDDADEAFERLRLIANAEKMRTTNYYPVLEDTAEEALSAWQAQNISTDE